MRIKKAALLILVVFVFILSLSYIVNAVCCQNGCFPDKNVCCSDGNGYVGCQDGNGNYYCYGAHAFPIGESSLPDACLTCACTSQDDCQWETNTFCQEQYTGESRICRADNPTSPTATECGLPPLCPLGTTLCSDNFCREICNDFPSCGDDCCDPDESCSSCPQDCGACPTGATEDYCGNSYCGPTESPYSCPTDCGNCCPNPPCYNCNNNNDCELGEGCLCDDCNLKEDSCASGLRCIDGLCGNSPTSCTSCEDCDGLIGGCPYEECSSCGASCYYSGYSLLFNDCNTCSGSTTCEDYEQTERTCNSDSCNLNNCFWDGASCTTVDYIRINPPYLTVQRGISHPLTVNYYINDQVYDVTSSSSFSPSKPDTTTIVSNIVTALAATDITATYNGKSATAHITVVEERLLSYITIEPLTSVLNVNGQLSYRVTAYYSDLTYSDVSTDANTWYESSDPSVASIPFDSNIVAALSAGNALITAHYHKGGIEKSAEARIKVTESARELSHIRLEPQHSSIMRGITTQYKVTAYYSDNTEEDMTSSPLITYESTNHAVASITGNTATAISTGITTIIARYTSNQIIKTDYSILEVSNKKIISDMAVNPDAAYLLVNSKQPITISIRYSDGTSKSCPGLCEELKQSLVIGIIDDKIAEIVYNKDTHQYEIKGKELGITEAIFSYTEDETTVEYIIVIIVDEPDTAQEFCELVSEGAQAICSNLETSCWAEAANEDAEYTDTTKCCGNNNDEIWRYTAFSYNEIFSNQNTCYNKVWYAAPQSPITYYSIYSTKG